MTYLMWMPVAIPQILLSKQSCFYLANCLFCVMNILTIGYYYKSLLMVKRMKIPCLLEV